MLTKEDNQKIVTAIQSAERQTSGEVVVHIEKSCASDPYQRALHWFKKLKLHQTVQRNGVLILLIEKQRRFAIVGDQGIHAAVQQGYWDHEAELLSQAFKAGRYADGLCATIVAIGEKLQTHFPSQGKNDINELGDKITHS